MPIPSTDTMTGTDYSDPGNWLRIPDVIHDVDTFYLYPTTYINPSPGAPDVCDIDDPIMLAGALDKLVERGSVICSTASGSYIDTKQTNLFGPASLHNMDYGMNYDNLVRNVAVRTEAYLSGRQ